MPVQLYSVNHQPVETLLTWIKSGEIAIPEIQRPFVWDGAKVRDLIDSLFQGYPVGYLITWKNPNIRLKDGSISQGRRILIDGQQRIMALLTALLGREVVNKNYKKKHIEIAFHPGERKFEVTNAAINRDKEWISNIACVFTPEAWMSEIIDKYCEANPGTEKRHIDGNMRNLAGIIHNAIGIIDLEPHIDVETAAEIFERVNSKGVTLNAADFAMSKMAANEQFDGHLMRKCIDYFCHLAVSPEAYTDLSADQDFASTSYFQAMSWLRNEKDDLYDPSYTDMLRVVFASKFKRGRLEDLVALLSGRNFETRTFEESIAEESFQRLRDGLFRYMNETSFKRFVMILRSAGFKDSSLIRSQNTVNFAYVLYLTLREKGTAPALVENLVRRWFVMSVLTGRYTNSPETTFGVDITSIHEQGADTYLDTIERANLSDAFWNVGLPQRMNTPVASSPYFNVFLASQIHKGDKGFLSKEIDVQTLIEGQSHIHHVFPRNYLKCKGLPASRYNQIANYVVMQSEINIAIGDKPPTQYFSELQDQCNGGEVKYGAITSGEEMDKNLATHCIPDGMETRDAKCYDTFLQERRSLMAQKIRDYYRSL